MTIRIVGVLALFAVTSQECCDPEQHEQMQKGSARIQACTDRNGVAVTAWLNDSGGHRFEVLTGCALPCLPTPAEKP